MEKTLISILMPAKNAAAFLEECVQSILAQSYANWELLVVDDFSADNTLDLLTKFAAQDKRIQVFQNKQDGIIPALQLAYQHGKGNFITRMDADDKMAANKLELMVSDMQQHGKGHLGVGLVSYFCEGELGAGFQKYEQWLNQLTITGSNFKEIYKECVIPSPCWMLHRSDFEAVGAFNSSIYPEDYDLAFRMKQVHLKCIPSSTVLHFWRDYATRTSRTNANYADSSFIAIKLHYFLKLDYQQNKKLVVWGAGSKGKKVAQLLQKDKIDFHWICDNPKKIGKDIYDKKLLPITALAEIENAQSIITVANPNAQKEIKAFLKKENKIPMKDYFFFC